MLAIASLASGFVVAAVTPSHALGTDTAIGALDVEGTLSKVDSLAGDSLAVDGVAPGQGSLAQTLKKNAPVAKKGAPAAKKGAPGQKY